MKVRDVHCVDTRDQRLLRPFHCQAVLYKPPAQLPCQSTPCLDWYTSSWREVGAAGQEAEGRTASQWGFVPGRAHAGWLPVTGCFTPPGVSPLSLEACLASAQCLLVQSKHSVAGQVCGWRGLSSLE